LPKGKGQKQKTKISMQLKGLVRFFTIVLILVSVYMLSFTWFVRAHENKLQARAKKEIQRLYPQAKKISNPKTILILLKMFMIPA
jgi:type II secretory pathway component PulL